MNKTVRISIRLERWLYEELKKQIEKNKIPNDNLSEYIRRTIVNDMPTANPEIKKLLTEIKYAQAKIGGNINQIVKNNNSYLYTQADKKELFLEMQEMKQLHESCLQELKRLTANMWTK